MYNIRLVVLTRALMLTFIFFITGDNINISRKHAAIIYSVIDSKYL